MLGAEPALPLAVLDRRGERPHVRRLELAVVVHADAERIEDGGDPGGGDLRVMGLDRGDRVPADARARRVVALEVVGVELDQPRDQPVAVKVDAGMARTGIVDRGDRAAADDDVAVGRSHRAGRCARCGIRSRSWLWLGQDHGDVGESLSDHQFAQLL